MCATRNLADEAFSFLNFGVCRTRERREIWSVSTKIGEAALQKKNIIFSLYISTREFNSKRKFFSLNWIVRFECIGILGLSIFLTIILYSLWLAYCFLIVSTR
jgi:hypothetical protein